jgi:hypothetical protein
MPTLDLVGDCPPRQQLLLPAQDGGERHEQQHLGDLRPQRSTNPDRRQWDGEFN